VPLKVGNDVQAVMNQYISSGHLRPGTSIEFAVDQQPKDSGEVKMGTRVMLVSVNGRIGPGLEGRSLSSVRVSRWRGNTGNERG
jgi:hypothetical protein